MSIALSAPESRANLTKMVTKRIDLNYTDGFVRIVMSVQQADGTEGREHEIILRAGTPEATAYQQAVTPAPRDLRDGTELWLIQTGRIGGSIA